jgi:hypothetical protein
VFLARFTAVVRAFVPLLAGVLKMSTGHFYVANILSALVWAPMHVFPGVLVGWAIAFGTHSPALSLAALGVPTPAHVMSGVLQKHPCGSYGKAPGEGDRSRPGPSVPRGGLQWDVGERHSRL